MTVSALITRNDITATASQTVFIYTFRVLEATDMAVYQNGALLSSGYTVNGVNNTTGGTVVLDVGASAGQIVSLVLAMPLDRTTNYQNSGKFLADDVNEDFDKIYIGAIQNENLNDRSLRLKDVEPPTTGVDMTIPLKSQRLGKYLAFNSVTGAPEVVAGTGGSVTDASLVNYTPAGTGAVVTTVQNKLRESVSVKDFGAVGDGTTDDTAAIQAAINYVVKGTIIFPDSTGSYKTTAVFSSDTNITMLFTGQYGISGSATPTNAVYMQGIPTFNNLNATGIFKVVDSSGAEQLRVATDYETNAFVGRNAGVSNTPLSTTEGRQNTFVGAESGLANTTGYASDNFGFASGASNTTGSRNTNIGYQSGYGNVTGSNNVNLGTDAGSTNTADHNIFIGFHSGFGFPALGTGENNIFIGSETALSITSAHNNTLVGRASGYDLTTGYDNVTLGSSTGRELEDGYQNVLLGRETGKNLISGFGNCLTGFRSGFYATGYLNSSIGSFSLFNLTTGVSNTAIGSSAGYDLTTGIQNTFIGYQAGFGVGQLNSASYSMALGYGAVTTKNDQAVIGGANIQETVLRGDVLAPKIKIGGTAAEILAGTGTPEGVVIAQIGSIYMRVDGSTGTALYVKESGTGLTGWVAK